MTTLILELDNKTKVEAIKAFAKEMDIKFTEKETEEETDEYYYWKGVKIRKASGKLDVEKMAGSLSDIHFDDPAEIRKKAWTRTKAQF